MSTSSSRPDRQLPQPAFREHRCISVTCTGCGEHYNDEFIYHFASIGDAVRAIATQDWSVSRAAVLCPSCSGDATGTSPSPAALAQCEFCWPPLFSDTPPPDRCRCRDEAITHVLVPFASYSHPGFEQQTCLTIHCSDCDDDLGYEDSTPHFPSETDARAAATRAGWLVAAQPFTCKRCTNRRACTTLGHSWPEASNFVSADAIEYRCCLRGCDEYVMNPVGDKDMPWL